MSLIAAIVYTKLIFICAIPEPPILAETQWPPTRYKWRCDVTMSGVDVVRVMLTNDMYSEVYLQKNEWGQILWNTMGSS